MKDVEPSEKVVPLVPRTVMDRVGRRESPGRPRAYRVARLAKKQLRSEVVAPEPSAELVVEAAAAEDTVEPIQPVAQVVEYQPGECFEVFEMTPGVMVVRWKLEKIDEWMAPVLGAACRDLLGKREVGKVVFDFLRVTEISTAAISTLIRFRNSGRQADLDVHVVAQGRFREELERAALDRILDVRESVYALIQPAAARPGFLGRFLKKR